MSGVPHGITPGETEAREVKNSSGMRISLCNSTADAERWEEFVATHPQATSCHRWNWKQVIENSFGWPTFYLEAEEDGRIRGVLPLVWQKSWLFGSFVSSMPFLNAGGIVAETQAAEQLLLEEAIRLAKRLGAEHLELRHREDHGLNLPTRTRKATVVLPVEQDTEKMWKALRAKVRNQIRKAMNFRLTVGFGRQEFLGDFYAVFSENMRDLGTPVYSRKFFSEILRAFPSDAHICVVRHEGRPVATSFRIGFRDRIEAVWSSSIRKYLSMNPNMFLYWQLLCFAGQRSYRMFDFGRSSIGSGTHAFKVQWGSQTIPLHWIYWLRASDHLPQVNPENAKYRIAIRAWQKLPLALTRAFGPRIARCLP